MTNIEPEAPHCKVCGNLQSAPAIYCDKCKFPQTATKQCIICGHLIPEAAHRCNHCQVFQDWRRRIPAMSAVILSLLTALASLLPDVFAQVANLIHSHSHTSVKFLRADPTVIHLQASNTGRAPSTLRRYRLKFGDVPIEDAWLDPAVNSMTVIQGGGQSLIGLRVPGLQTRPRTEGKEERVPCSEVVSRLPNATILLEIDVDESSGTVVRQDSFPGYLIEDVITKKLECRK